MALYLSETTSIIFKTMPYLFLRAAAYLAFGIAFGAYWVLIFFMGRALAGIHPNIEFFVWIIGLLVSFPIIRLVREYLLYLIKTGHVAVIATLAMKGNLPEGVGQIEFGKKMVTDHFKQSSSLFVVDRLIHGVIHALNGMMMGLTSFMSGIPGMDGLRKIMRTILYFSLTYIDEAILARHFLNPQQSIWENSRKGIILYAQIWKSIFVTAIITGLLSLVSLPILLFMTVGPALAASVGHPAQRWLFVIFGIIAAWILKVIFLEPFTLTQMVIVYLKGTASLQPNAEWEQKIQNLSSKFREIQEKARSQPI